MAKTTTYETATNSYTTTKLLGEGGAGTVFLVVDSEGTEHALKRLRSANSAQRKRFKNELVFGRRNRHPNIVTVIDEGIYLDGDQRSPFYVMPLYESSLRKLMIDRVNPDDVIGLFRDVLDGVEAAHLLGVVHRDLKPENLLVETNRRRIVVADFGIAHFEEEHLATAVRTQAADRLANFRYASPEQRVVGQNVDARCDIYALGLILNEMFTGEVPQGTGIKLISGVAPKYGYLDPIVDKMIQQDSQCRPDSIGEVKNLLIMAGVYAVTRQKLDNARMEIVPATTPDDVLGGKDVVASAFDFDAGLLVFRLQPEPPSEWIHALRHIGKFGSIPGLADPGRVEFRAWGWAHVPAKVDLVVEIAKLVQEWVDSANAAYRKHLIEKAAEKERFYREALADRQRELEKKIRALDQLKSAGLV